MGEHRRKADGRRVFTTEFKRATVQRIVAGEKTVAELSRELDIAPSVIRNWKRFAEAGATTAVQASEDVVPATLVELGGQNNDPAMVGPMRARGARNSTVRLFGSRIPGSRGARDSSGWTRRTRLSRHAPSGNGA